MTMQRQPQTSGGGVLSQLTLPELIDLWVEDEIEKRLRQAEFFYEEIVAGAQHLEHLQVMPLRGGFRDRPRSIEVLVEIRDNEQRCSRIGAGRESKRTRDDPEAFQRAYDKAMAHAIIQLLPADVWRRWIGASAYP
ncbi:MAG TPA: hypothetical protein QGG47_10625 [Acidobacteriota bacterium]|nr:hypothetical protein [Acidobacteriota bacterium]